MSTAKFLLHTNNRTFTVDHNQKTKEDSAWPLPGTFVADPPEPQLLPGKTGNLCRLHSCFTNDAQTHAFPDVCRNTHEKIPKTLKYPEELIWLFWS